MAYYFGGYQLDSFLDGLGNILLSKNIDSPVLNPVSFPIARYEGMKKSGESIGTRQIDIVLKIIGSSRSDLISRIDTLQSALSKRAQTLVIQEDGRFYQEVNCVDAKVQLAGGKNVLACTVPIQFIAQDPYGYKATSSSHDTGTLTLTSSGGTWNSSAIDITGGGTYHSFPLIRLTNKTSTGSTTLTTARNNGVNYTTLPVSSTSFSGSVGDKLQLDNGSATQTVTVATAFSAGATTITVSSFTANATYGIGATVLKLTQWDSISVTQAQDSQTIRTYSTDDVPLPKNNDEYVDIQCEPIEGMSIMTNASGELHDPIGVFPSIGSDTTTFNISVASNSEVKIQAVFSWVSRYLS